MLSATHTLNDIKDRLTANPTDYGYETEDALSVALTRATEDARIQYMYPAIGDGRYQVIAAKDKQGLSKIEERIYWADVYFSLGMFLLECSGKEAGLRKAETTSGSNKFGSGSSSGRIGKEKAGGDAIDRATYFLMQAGYVKSTTVSAQGIATEWRQITEWDNVI